MAACAVAAVPAWTACGEGDPGANADAGAGSGTDVAAVAEEGGCFGPSPAASAASAAPGEELARELGCAVCHGGVPSADPAASRVRLSGAVLSDPAFVFGYLRVPRRLRDDGRARMPGFHLDAPERLALALHLEARAAAAGGAAAGGRSGAAGPEPVPWARCRDRDARRRAEAAFRRARDAAGDGVDAELGGRIYRALGCGRCHPAGAPPGADASDQAGGLAGDAAVRAGEPPGPDLGAEAARARPAWLRAWLRAPTALRPFGPRPGSGARMPDFGLSVREADSLAGWLQGGSFDGPEGAGADRRRQDAAGRRRAERLLRQRLPCLGCHRLEGEGGRIGPRLDDVAVRRPAAYIAAAVRAPLATLPAGIMPPTRMPEEDRALLIDYLSGLDGSGPGRRAATAVDAPEGARAGYLSLVEHPPASPVEPDAAAGSGGGPGSGEASQGTPGEGTALYGRYCVPCHGPSGGGNGYNARWLPVPPTPHAAPSLMRVRSDAALYDAIWAGGRVLGGSPRMPGFGEALGRPDVRALVAEIRRLCDCRGPAWERDGEGGAAPAPGGEETP